MISKSAVKNKIIRKINSLSFKGLILSSSHSDGRINSSIDEEIILNRLLENRYLKDKIQKANKERNWFDFCISFTNKNKEEHFFPINIKVIEGNKNDNLNCKLGLYYCLTGQVPTFPNEIGWKEYFLKLKENMKENNKDYYFLVVNKKDLSHMFIGLRQINKLAPNRNNLPFQCNFNDQENTKINNQDYQKDKERLLSCFYESIKKRATIRDYFEKNFVKNGRIK